MKPGEIKFIADNMFGRLTRWLRIMGYDTLYPPPDTDRELISTAASQNRTLLTRDKTIAQTKKANVIFIRGDSLEEQLEQLVSELKLELKPELEENENGMLKNRCAICNGVLRSIPSQEAVKEVPEGVRDHQDHFWRCSGCKKIYWEGSHWDQIKDRLKQINAD